MVRKQRFGGDLREAHESRDVSISPDEVGSRKGLESKVGWSDVSKVGRSDDRFHDALTSCSNIPLDPSQSF